MRKLKVAVIGLGNMGSRHLRVYSEFPEVELIAIADLSEEKKEEALRYGIRFYQDFQEMLKKERLDVVSICVPTTLHFEVAKECIQKGINILLEKPISDNLENAEKLLKLSKKFEVKFLVGHIERFNPAVKKLKEILDKRILGNPISIIARRIGIAPPKIQDTDVAVDLAIHDIDIINFLLNSVPSRVLAHKRKNLFKSKADSVEFLLRYPDVSAFIQANWISPVKIRKLAISGSLGYLEMDYLKQEIVSYKSILEKTKVYSNKFSDYIFHFAEPEKVSVPVTKQEPLKEEIRFFTQSILNNKEINSQFAIDALRTALNYEIF